MKKFYQQKSFKKLQDKWYKKLNEKGFDDIEHVITDQGKVRQTKYIRSTKSAPSRKQYRNSLKNTSQYYKILNNFLSSAPFYPNLKLFWRIMTKNQAFSENKHKILDNLCNNNKNYLTADKKAYKNLSTADQAYQVPDLEQFRYLKGYELSKAEFKKKYKTFKAFQADQVIHYCKNEYHTLRLHLEGLTIRQISKELKRMHNRGKLNKPKKKKNPFSVGWIHGKIRKLKKHSDLSGYVELSSTREEDDGLRPEDNTPVNIICLIFLVMSAIYTPPISKNRFSLVKPVQTTYIYHPLSHIYTPRSKNPTSPNFSNLRTLKKNFPISKTKKPLTTCNHINFGIKARSSNNLSSCSPRYPVCKAHIKPYKASKADTYTKACLSPTKLSISHSRLPHLVSDAHTHPYTHPSFVDFHNLSHSKLGFIFEKFNNPQLANCLIFRN